MEHNLTPVIDVSKRTPIEIALQVDEEGKTTAKKLYDFLELHPAHYAKWCKVNILGNQFTEKGKDFEVLVSEYENPTKGGRPTKDYKLSASFAKKLAMASNSPKGEEARKYFIQVEERLKNRVMVDQVKLTPELQMVKALFENAVKQQESIEELKDDMAYVKKQLDSNVIEMPMEPEEDNVQLILSQIYVNKPARLYTITDIARVFGVGSVRLNKFLETHGILVPTKINKGWELAERYAAREYTVEKQATFEGQSVNMIWWTEAGANFLLEFLSTKGLVKKAPLVHKSSRKKKDNL